MRPNMEVMCLNILYILSNEINLHDMVMAFTPSPTTPTPSPTTPTLTSAANGTIAQRSNASGQKPINENAGKIFLT